MHFFEGVEKRIIVNFSVDPSQPMGLRSLSTEAWKGLCRHARCSILSRTSNDYFDAYVLSESSLFVYPNHIIAKTCGSTTLLHAVEPLIELAASVGCEPEGMCFTRMNYNFPEGQVYPHTSFEEEVEYLDETFVGKPYILGSLDAERYHMYLADSAEDGSDKKILEVQMFELDPETMKNFFRGSEGLDGETQTRLSGVDTILPGSTIDSFAFDPCGYSMNGLLDNSYWTIHITPEDHCSYVSFETNLALPDYGELLDRVVGVFKPKRICVSLLARKDALKNGSGRQDIAISGFKRSHASNSQAADAHELSYASFTKEDSDSPIKRSASQSSVLRKIISPAMPAAKNRVSGRQATQTNLLGMPLNSSSNALAQSNDGRASPRSEASGDHSVSTIPFSPFSPSCAVKACGGESTGAIMDEIREHLNGSADSFFVVDLGRVTGQYQRWHKELPMVTPYFAVKANPDPTIVKHLASLGVSFDCASEAEMAMVLAMGVSPNRVVYANPCRPTSHLRFAKAHNVDLLTADNTDELRKIAEIFPTSRVLIRISPLEADAICPLGAKFGATERGVTAMLDLAKELRIDIAGVAFHVGSGTRSLNSYVTTLIRAKAVFDQAAAAGFRPRVLDIGGGMPGKDGVDSPLHFADIAATLRPLLKEHFGSPSVKIIAEPGRFFVADAQVLATRVIARRDCTGDLPQGESTGPMSDSDDAGSLVSANTLARSAPAKFLYYVGDGVYASFNNLIYDHAVVVPMPLRRDGTVADDNAAHLSTIFGPTCDALDCISIGVTLPQMEVGDWFFWETMGAYTSAAGGNFNGFSKPSAHYINTAPVKLI